MIGIKIVKNVHFAVRHEKDIMIGLITVKNALNVGKAEKYRMYGRIIVKNALTVIRPERISTTGRQTAPDVQSAAVFARLNIPLRMVFAICANQM